MTLSLSPEIRDARLQSIVDALDGGSGPGYLEFYDGTRPSTGGTTTTLLSTHVLASPSGTVLDQALTFDVIEDEINAPAAGSATWVRFYDGDGVFCIDASCGLTGSGADFLFDDDAILVGGLVHITAGAISEGAA